MMIKKLKEGGVSYLGFEGGEPLLRNDIDDILYESYKRFHTSMVTNGWPLAGKIDNIKNCLDFLFVSIDGGEEIHDEMRGIKGSFKHAVEGIKASKGEVQIAVSSTITEDNIDHIDEILDLLRKLDVAVNFQMEYDYKTADNISPEKEKLSNLLDYLIKEKENNSSLIMNTKQYFESIKNSWFNGIK